MSALELLPTLAPATRTPAITAEEWAEEAASTADGIATLRQLAELHATAKKGRHAENTQTTYDYWWGRLQAWMAEPSQRVRGRALPAAPLSTLTSDTPGAQQILLLWLFELVYGPEDPVMLKEWIEDHGYLSPNTLHSVWSAVKCRLQDQTGRRFAASTDTEAVLTGLHNFLRMHYGADRPATPLLGHHIRSIVSFLARARDPLVARDRLVLELSAVDLTAAQIARIDSAAVHEPDPEVRTKTARANQRLWDDRQIVGMRTLVVPGQVRSHGRQDAPLLIVVEAGSPLQVALDDHLRFRDPTDPWLIDGLSSSNRRSQVREILCALGAHTEDGWKPSKETPRVPPEIASAMRLYLLTLESADGARRRRDIAMIWISWLCALRRDELVSLNVGDLEKVARRYLIHIRQSKTDQDMKGVTLPIVTPTDLTVAPELNPVAAIDAWLDELERIHGSELLPGTPLFPALTRSGAIFSRRRADGDGRTELRVHDRMNAQTWSDRLRDLASWTGLFADDPEALEAVSGHSTRRGFVTAAALAGKTSLEIRRTTRHVDLNSLARYVAGVQDAHREDVIGVDDLILRTVS
jgi:integrase